MLLNSDIIKEKNIGIGDEVFMTGLFTNHSGKEKNIPIVRIGNIAAMPDEPIRSADFGNLHAYLVELRSLGGLSGSPVFVYLTPSRIINGTHNLNSYAEFFLLGLLHGHWDLKSATKGVELDQFTPNKETNINTGIGIAVPACGILEIIQHHFPKPTPAFVIPKIQ